jgi:class 3 adenylate cyclase/tetratricopeptide (TPR) repeat protein
VTSRATATVLFTDLVGSTELRGRLGEEAADELRHVHDRLLTEAVERNGGRVLKGLGDGIMASFTGAADAVAASVAVQQAVDRLNRSGKAASQLAVRVGLSAGDVTFEDDDVHGTPVIEASRLCAAADGGAILAAEVVRILSGSVGGHTYTAVGPLELKGLDHPVHTVQVAWEPTATASLPIPPLLTELGRVFVGRETELERVKLRWKEALAGERRVVLFAGEPGVGKTRLAAEAAAFVYEEFGGVVLAGRCDEDLGVPYQPFVEALRHFLDHTPSEQLRDRLGRYGGELVRLLPEVAERLPDLPPPLRSDPETERYRLFDAVAAWLAAVSSEQPLLLVLDDLQWAAKPTLLLLRHVLHTPEPSRLLVVATYRDTDIGRGHPLGELLADLRRDTGVERIALSGLTMAGVLGYLEAASGHGLADEDETAFAMAIHDETNGNPFFLREVLRHLVETGGIAERDGRWGPTVDIDRLGIPEGVRDVVGRRLSRLSDLTNQVLTAAAVIGPAFDVSVVGPVSGLDDDDLLAALEEAEAARIVAEVPSVAPCYRFTHNLVRDTLYDELSAGRRARLHRRAAETIESVHAGRLAEHLSALANHYSRAAAPAGKTGAKAVGYAVQAGVRALEQLAHDEAVAWYHRALDLLDGAGAFDEATRLDVLVALGEAQQRAGDPAHRDTLLEAARSAQRLGRTDALVRAALANTRAVIYSAALEVDADRVATLEAALEAIGETDSPERAELLAYLGVELVWAGDRARRIRHSDEAIAVARRVADPVLLARVLPPRFYTIWSPATLSERLEITAELVELAERLDDQVLRFRSFWLRFRAALEGADGEEARRCEEITTDLADDLRRPLFRWLAGWTMAGRANLDGRIEDAAAQVVATRGIGLGLGLRDAEITSVTQGCGLLVSGADVPGIGEAVAAVAARTGYPNYFPLLALAHLRDGDAAAAWATLSPLAADEFSALPMDVAWAAGIACASVVAAELRKTEAAECLFRLLSPYRDQVIVAAAMPFGAVSHFLGLLAATFGDHDGAAAAFATAADLSARIGAPGFLAGTRTEWGRLLLRRGHPGDADQARRFLTQALDTARQLALPKIERDAVALLG